MADGTTPRGRKRSSGRRTGDSGTRDAILQASRELFADLGYEGTSVRAIAGAAGVDPALVRHFFGDKEVLFATTVAERQIIPERISAALEGDRDALGQRVADSYLRAWEDPATGAVLLALVRSATTSQHAAEMLREVLVDRLRVRAAREDASGADDRGGEQLALAASHLLGVALARFVIKVPPIAELSHDELVAELAPTIQRYLTGTHR